MNVEPMMPPAPLLLAVISPISPMAVNVESRIALDRALVPPAMAVMVPKLPRGSSSSCGAKKIRPGAEKMAFSMAFPPFTLSA